jgi:LPS-assembly protein
MRVRLRLQIIAYACLLSTVIPLGGFAQQPASPPASSEVVVIEADTQQKIGDVFHLQGNAEIRYGGMTLQADEVTYSEETGIAEAHGNVVFEQEDDRIEATEARYNVRDGTGTFLSVQGTVGPRPRPSRDYLITQNPYYFEAEEVDRRSDGSYLARNGWVTNCEAGRPKWRLKAARAKIRPGKDVQLHRSTFLIRGVPIFFAPYWWISAADVPRKSGFLMPSFGNDSRRGTNIGESFFWAINPHADLTLGAEFFNKGGWTQLATFRALPSQRSTVSVQYFGAIAGKLNRKEGIEESGQFVEVVASNYWANGFRAVADITYLSSLRFRQRFSGTFNEAVRSETRSTAFVTYNPDTFYFNGFFDRYENFIRIEPEESLTLFAAPGVEFGTRPRRLSWWKSLPIYFSFDSQVAGMSRDEPRFETPELVQRFTLYPQVTIPLRLGRYFGFTPTVGVRASRYSARVVDDPAEAGGKLVVNDSLRRITQEVSVDLRLPSFVRVFETGRARYKHAIEPEVIYRYVNGVRDFEEILRFDEEDILTDTHEIEYAITHRLYTRPLRGAHHVREFMRWRLSQKYYFDPDFRGALRPGERNVFAALNSLTPFAFADQPRRFSPIVSDLRFNWSWYNTDFRLDYDTKKSRLVNTRLRAGVRLSRLLSTTLSHYSTRNDDLLQPRSNQLRLLTRYGSSFRPGFNAAVAISWNIKEDFLQNTVTQVSYNWDCCGVAFEFRRLGLGTVRSENEYRFSFTIANVGTFGTIAEERRLF